MYQLERKLEANFVREGGITVNILFDYGGHQEIMDAVDTIMSNPDLAQSFQALGLKPEKKKALLSKYLYTGTDPENNDKPLPEPEVILRTGGEVRSSNFLPYQSQYSEWIYDKRMWPSFDMYAFLDTVAEYQMRKRNFGK